VRGLFEYGTPLDLDFYLRYHSSMKRQLAIVAAFALTLTVLGVTYGAGMKRKVVAPKDFPAGKPFSAGMQFGDTLYVSGSTGADLKTGKVPDKFEDEVQLCFDNIGAIMKAGGYDFSDAVSVQVYLTDMTLFPRMNAVYTKVFPEPRPTRTTVGVTALAGAAHMEVTVTARK
jgi:2-iminobutanoate/2-iminopropanoate deaminase